MKVYQELSNLLIALVNCEKSDNTEWAEKHEAKIKSICENDLPNGSGFDSGTELLILESEANKLKLQANFHHMDDNGFYCGWSEHIITITPDLACGFNIKVSGINKRGIKEYIADVFNEALNQECSK